MAHHLKLNYENYGFVKTLVVTGFVLLAFYGLNAQNDGFFRPYNDFYNNRDNVDITDGGDGFTVEPFGGEVPFGFQ